MNLSLTPRCERGAEAVRRAAAEAGRCYAHFWGMGIPESRAWTRRRLTSSFTISTAQDQAHK